MTIPMGPDGTPDIVKMQKDMEEASKAADAARKIVEFRVNYADYHDVDGVKVPFHFSRSVAGKPTEDITFDKVKLNAKIDPRKFDVSK